MKQRPANRNSRPNKGGKDALARRFDQDYKQNAGETFSGMAGYGTPQGVIDSLSSGPASLHSQGMENLRTNFGVRGGGLGMPGMGGMFGGGGGKGGMMNSLLQMMLMKNLFGDTDPPDIEYSMPSAASGASSPAAPRSSYRSPSTGASSYKSGGSSGGGYSGGGSASGLTPASQNVQNRWEAEQSQQLDQQSAEQVSQAINAYTWALENDGDLSDTLAKIEGGVIAGPMGGEELADYIRTWAYKHHPETDNRNAAEKAAAQAVGAPHAAAGVPESMGYQRPAAAKPAPEETVAAHEAGSASYPTGVKEAPRAYVFPDDALARKVEKEPAPADEGIGFRDVTAALGDVFTGKADVNLLGGGKSEEPAPDALERRLDSFAGAGNGLQGWLHGEAREPHVVHGRPDDEKVQILANKGIHAGDDGKFYDASDKEVAPSVVKKILEENYDEHREEKEKKAIAGLADEN